MLSFVSYTSLVFGCHFVPVWHQRSVQLIRGKIFFLIIAVNVFQSQLNHNEPTLPYFLIADTDIMWLHRRPVVILRGHVSTSYGMWLSSLVNSQFDTASTRLLSFFTLSIWLFVISVLDDCGHFDVLVPILDFWCGRFSRGHFGLLLAFLD